MKQALITLLGLVVISAVAQAQVKPTPAPEAVKIVKGDYTLTLPAGWKIAPKTPPGKFEAFRTEEKDGEIITIGTILAAELNNSIEEESAELANSITQNLAIGTVIDNSDFVLKDGTKGKKLLLSLRVQNKDYGTPMIFYSIYLPEDNGGSVTFKLQCGQANQVRLCKEFDNIIANAVKAAPKPTLEDKTADLKKQITAMIEELNTDKPEELKVFIRKYASPEDFEDMDDEFLDEIAKEFAGEKQESLKTILLSLADKMPVVSADKRAYRFKLNEKQERMSPSAITFEYSEDNKIFYLKN